MGIGFQRDHTPEIGVALTLQPGLRVVTAPNAGPMTFTGTQSYLLGQDELAVIDPGPEDAAHFAALLQAIGRAKVSHIFVTHSHIDHSALARRLSQKTGAPISGFGRSDAARSDVMNNLAKAGNLGGREGIDAEFVPDNCLKDGQKINGSDWQLQAIHTPGHLSNHMCFAWSNVGALFSGDHVMGWATTLISPPDGDLTAFMASLEKLEKRQEDHVYFPGHGAALNDPLAMVNQQLAHRRLRESQILNTLTVTPQTAAELAVQIYSDLDPHLLGAATRNVLAHLIDLKQRRLVQSEGAITQHCGFRRI